MYAFDRHPVCLMNMIRRLKRTTLVLEESCLEGIRDLARREGKNLSAVANELFAEGLHRRKARKRPEFILASYSMGKTRVNLGDRNALEALTTQQTFRAARDSSEENNP
jgi:hypothetical protein